MERSRAEETVHKAVDTAFALGRFVLDRFTGGDYIVKSGAEEMLDQSMYCPDYVEVDTEEVPVIELQDFDHYPDDGEALDEVRRQARHDAWVQWEARRRIREGR